MKKIIAGIAGVAFAASSPLAAQELLTAQGPQGELAGTLIRPADGAPLVIVIPGSGPTDRDGNNPAGVRAVPYRLLAEALGERGVGTLRIDKRGMFGSKSAVADANAVTIDDYVADVAAWTGAAQAATGRECVWVMGHSEGGLVALAAAQKVPKLCGIIVAAGPGRPMGTLLREQLGVNPANAPLMPDALSAIERLEKGERVDVSNMHPALQGLFNPAVQGFLIDLMARDPAALASNVTLPMLIVQGGRDIQVARADGEALRNAQPAAKYVYLSEMNHVLKNVGTDDRAANLAASERVVR